MSVIDEVIHPYLKDSLGQAIFEGMKSLILEDNEKIQEFALAAASDLAVHVLNNNRAMTEEIQAQFMALLDVKRIKTTKRTKAMVKAFLWSVGQAAIKAGIAAAASALFAKGDTYWAKNMREV